MYRPMDGGAWWAAVHGVAKSQTRLSTIASQFSHDPSFASVPPPGPQHPLSTYPLRCGFWFEHPRSFSQVGRGSSFVRQRERPGLPSQALAWTPRLSAGRRESGLYAGGELQGSPVWAGAFWAQTEDPSGCGAASPSQGRWDPDSLRPALSLGGQATAHARGEGERVLALESREGTRASRRVDTRKFETSHVGGAICRTPPIPRSALEKDPTMC